MLSLQFSGWFQCRLATDPDSFDDLRGQSGWTFAYPGEPDLDRVIRFHDPLAPRSHGPEVGVFVRAAHLDGAPAPGHPLEGARVDLLDSAVFEGRNGEIATSASEPIAPFHLAIAGGGVSLIARDPIDLADLSEIARRQPFDFEGNSAEVLQTTGVLDPAAYRQQRRALLLQDLVAETDPVRIEALERRIQQLQLGSILLRSLGFKLSYQFELRGPNDWQAPSASYTPAPTGTWSTDFWMGGWDADALCGYVSGSLSVP